MTDAEYRKTQLSRDWLERSTPAWREYRVMCQNRETAFQATINGVAQYENDGSGRAEGGEDKHESALVRYSQICEEIEQAHSDLSVEQTKTLEAIRNMKVENERAVLEARYIKHWAVSKVEKELHFSRSEQNRVHRKALISFYDANTELVEEYHEWHNSED